MASLQQHQNIEYEKANAMRTFQRKQMLENMFLLFNFCAALFLIWRSSWFPITLQALSHVYNTVLILLFNNSFHAFLLLNVIIFFLYVLSTNTAAAAGSGDAYDECCLPITTSTEAVNDPAVESSPVAVVCDSEVGESSYSPVFEETVTAVTETTTTTCCTTVTEEGEKKCYRRVKSESFERRVAAAPRRELSRFSTGLNNNRGMQRRMCCVEELSKEEFNRTVEDFIAKQKRMLLEEQIGSQKTEYLALAQ